MKRDSTHTLASGAIAPEGILAIFGKTEGNGCVNDFTRGYATLALKLMLAQALGRPVAEIEKRVAIVMSGGTEGGLSPHLVVFCRETAAEAAGELDPSHDALLEVAEPGTAKFRTQAEIEDEFLDCHGCGASRKAMVSSPERVWSERRKPNAACGTLKAPVYRGRRVRVWE